MQKHILSFLLVFVLMAMSHRGHGFLFAAESDRTGLAADGFYTGFIPGTEGEVPETAQVLITDKWHLSDAQPNPAQNQTWINYTIPTGTKSAQIVVRNLVGTQVMSEIIDLNVTRIRLDTQNLANGIYIFSLVIDNQTVSSKRLVVAK